MFLLSIAAKWVLLGRVKAGDPPALGLLLLALVAGDPHPGRHAHGLPGGHPLDPPLPAPHGRQGGQAHPLRHGLRARLRPGHRGRGHLHRRGRPARGLHHRGRRAPPGAHPIGERCCVGARAVLPPGSTMEDGSELGDLSMLPEGPHPRGPALGGLPRPAHARPRPAPPVREPPGPARPQIFAMAVAQGFGAFLVPVVFLASILPGMMLLNELWIRIPGYFGYLWAVPFAAVSYILLLSLAHRRWSSARCCAGSEPGPTTWSPSGTCGNGSWTSSWRVSLDLLGAALRHALPEPLVPGPGRPKVGRRAEISTAGAATPGPAGHRGGDLHRRRRRPWARPATTWAGSPWPPPGWAGGPSWATAPPVPGGTVLGDQALVGVLSVAAPGLRRRPRAPTPPGWAPPPSSCPGAPTPRASGRPRPTRPPGSLVALRLAIEFFRVTLPAMGFALLTCLLLTAMTVLEEDHRHSRGHRPLPRASTSWPGPRPASS